MLLPGLEESVRVGGKLVGDVQQMMFFQLEALEVSCRALRALSSACGKTACHPAGSTVRMSDTSRWDVESLHRSCCALVDIARMWL